jgi:hypothetical protein
VALPTVSIPATAEVALTFPVLVISIGWDREADQADQMSERSLSPHNKLALAISAIQIAIALACIAALTRRACLLTGAALAAVIGVSLLAAAWLVT